MNSLTFEEGRDAILTVFKDAWDGLGYPAVYEDVVSKPPTTQTIWARVILRHAIGYQSSLKGCDNTKRYTEEGTVFVQIFSPVGSGLVPAYNAAQSVSDAYIQSNHPNVWFKNVRINEMGSDGAFSQIQVHADFSYDMIV